MGQGDVTWSPSTWTITIWAIVVAFAVGSLIVIGLIIAIVVKRKRHARDDVGEDITTARGGTSRETAHHQRLPTVEELQRANAENVIPADTPVDPSGINLQYVSLPPEDPTRRPQPIIYERLPPSTTIQYGSLADVVPPAGPAGEPKTTKDELEQLLLATQPATYASPYTPSEPQAAAQRAATKKRNNVWMNRNFPIWI